MSIIAYGDEHEEALNRKFHYRRPGESEFEFVQRRGREADARAAAQMADFLPVEDRLPSAVAGPFSPQDIANGRQ